MKNQFIALAATVAACALAGSAAASEFITNGNFETGDLTGWTEVDAGSGSWFVIGNGGNTPLTGTPTPTLAGGGDFTATTDQGGPGSHDLSQTLLLAAGNYVFSFDARGNDESGSGGAPDQQYIVNVDGSTLAGPIIDPNWNHFSFDLSLGAGSHTFDFHENDDRFFFQAGVDNVSLTNAVPEPTTWALMIGGFGLAGATLRRRKALAA